MDIAFVYIAEAYQVYHGAAIALDLARRPGVSVTSFYNEPETVHHLERVRRAFDAPAADYRRLYRSPLTRAMQRLRRLGMFKDMVLRDNRAVLDRFDAIFAVENTLASVRRMGVAHPRLIYSPHGFGDRARGFIPRIATFDFVLLAGPKTEARMLAKGLVRPGDYALTGSVKLETGERLRDADPVRLAAPGPTVMYNPHKEPRLTSWYRFIEPMLAGFAAQSAMNLIVAPHVKLFRRRSAAVKAAWEGRGTPAILIDTGSDRAVDTSYVAAADIYVGDVSSQVYEFLATPRPCVFLNAHGIDWRDDPSFAHWHLGDVVDDPAQLMATIAAAPARHHLYRDRQARLAAASLGDHHRAAARAGDAIMAFLDRG